MQHHNILQVGKAGNASAGQGSTPRVDDERHNLLLLTQMLQRHHRILSPTNRNNHPFRIDNLLIMKFFNRLLIIKFKLEKLLDICFYSILIEKLTQPFPIKFLPPKLLIFRKMMPANQHFRRAGTFPVTDQLDEADVKNDAIEVGDMGRHPVLAGFQPHFRREPNRIANCVVKLYIYLIINNFITISFINKLRILLP